jgi:hypothetical protein
MGYFVSFAVFAVFAVSAYAWLTHVMSCIAAGAWGLLIAGSLLAPVGIVHGIMIWLGYSYL